MDPNLFHLDMERAGEVLIAIVLLSFFIERALAVLFESRPFIDRTEEGKIVVKMENIQPGDKNHDRILKQKKKKGLKESISFIVSVVVCWALHFDALTITFASGDETTVLGYIVTGAIVAGGSKASIKLFKDWMGFRSSAEDQLRDLRNSMGNN